MGNGTEEALNAEVVRRWYEIAGGGDLDALHEILATDTVDHVSGKTGVEWWKRILGAARACIDAEPGELDDLICSGDRVVARFTVRGRYTRTVRDWQAARPAKAKAAGPAKVGASVTPGHA